MYRFSICILSKKVLAIMLALPFICINSTNTAYQPTIVPEKEGIEFCKYIEHYRKQFLNIAFDQLEIATSHNNSLACDTMDQLFMQKKDIGDKVAIENADLFTASYGITGLSKNDVEYVGGGYSIERPTEQKFSYYRNGTLIIKKLNLFYDTLFQFSDGLYESTIDLNPQEAERLNSLPIIFEDFSLYKKEVLPLIAAKLKDARTNKHTHEKGDCLACAALPKIYLEKSKQLTEYLSNSIRVKFVPLDKYTLGAFIQCKYPKNKKFNANTDISFFISMASKDVLATEKRKEELFDSVRAHIFFKIDLEKAKYIS